MNSGVSIFDVVREIIALSAPRSITERVSRCANCPDRVLAFNSFSTQPGSSLTRQRLSEPAVFLTEESWLRVLITVCKVISSFIMLNIMYVAFLNVDVSDVTDNAGCTVYC